MAVTKTITQKVQGNGQQTWIIRWVEDGKDVKLPEIVYEDPTDKVEKTVKLTDRQLKKLLALIGE